MSVPTILNTTKVFDFKDLHGPNGKPLKHGLYMHAREYTNGDHHGIWTFASRNENPVGLKADAVVIVAKVGDRVLITDEFRIPLGLREYGFPAGLCDLNESPIVAAIRELREEAGLRAIGVYGDLTTNLLVSSAGLSDECVKMVFVEAEGEISHHLCEPSESIHAQLMDYDQTRSLLQDPTLAVSAKAWGLLWGWQFAGSLAMVPGGKTARLQKVEWAADDSFTVAA